MSLEIPRDYPIGSRLPSEISSVVPTDSPRILHIMEFVCKTSAEILRDFEFHIIPPRISKRCFTRSYLFRNLTSYFSRYSSRNFYSKFDQTYSKHFMYESWSESILDFRSAFWNIRRNSSYQF